MHPVKGVRLAVAAAGVRYQGRNDVVLIACDDVFYRHLLLRCGTVFENDRYYSS